MTATRRRPRGRWRAWGLGPRGERVGWTALLGDARGGPDVSPYAAPARATDLSGLPPAFIDVGSAETFRDEDVAYATRIWQAGGRPSCTCGRRFHGFTNAVPQAAVSRAAVAASGTGCAACWPSWPQGRPGHRTGEQGVVKEPGDAADPRPGQVSTIIPLPLAAGASLSVK